MKYLILCMVFFVGAKSYAAQSSIMESEGYACMGEDKSRKMTEEAAMSDARRKAIEVVSTYMKSETEIKNSELQKDIVSAYSKATVKVLQEIDKGWYRDPSMGDCYRLKIRAEIVPDENIMNKGGSGMNEEPSAPLGVKVWTDKKEYKKGEKIKVYLKGNKPFYARVVYKDAGGQLIQLLPNPFRNSNYFNGGVVYEIPSGDDRFELEVSPPFGAEGVIVYAGSSQVGELDLKATGGVFEIRTNPDDVGMKTRGIAIKEAGSEIKRPAEFSEASVEVKTGER